MLAFFKMDLVRFQLKSKTGGAENTKECILCWRWKYFLPLEGLSFTTLSLSHTVLYFSNSSLQAIPHTVWAQGKQNPPRHCMQHCHHRHAQKEHWPTVLGTSAWYTLNLPLSNQSGQFNLLKWGLRLHHNKIPGKGLGQGLLQIKTRESTYTLPQQQQDPRI